MQRFSAAMLAGAMFATAGCTADKEPRTAAASADARPLGQCFWPHEIRGYSSAGADSLYVEVGAGQRYLVDTLGSCPDLDFSFRVGLHNRGGGPICSAAGLEIVIPDPAGTRTCPVSSIRQVARQPKAGG